MDRDKYVEPLRLKIHIVQLEWDRAAKVGQTRQMDNNDVEARLESLQANPLQQPLGATVWLDEDMHMLCCFPRNSVVHVCHSGGV